MAERNRHFKPVALAFLGVVALVAALRGAPVLDWTLAFVHWVQQHGVVGALVYGTAYVLGTVLLLPGTALTAGAGLLYGTVRGTLLASPASVIGATLSFLCARYFLRGWVERKVARYPRFAAIDRAVGRHGFTVVLLLRLDPVFIPFTLLNYAFGLTRVSARDYILGSWLGMLPATILYVYLGSAVQDIAQVLRGDLPDAGGWGRLVFWGGLGAAALLAILFSRIAHQALQRQLTDGPAAAPSAEAA